MNSKNNILEDLPIRHRNHEIETLSERFFSNCIPVNWVLNPFRLDYGTDYNCEIAKDRKVTGLNFSVQLKGKEKELNKESIKIPLKKSTINRWLKRLEPTMLIVYIIEENEAYWIWFKENTVDLTSKNDSFTISISREQKLSEISWTSVTEYVEKIFSNRHLLYAVQEMNDNSSAWNLYRKNDFSKALPLFYELLSEHPEESSIFEAIAVCEYELHNYQKALVSINKALSVEHKYSFEHLKASILTEQGFVLDNAGRIIEAIGIYNRLIKVNHISYSLYYNLGSAYTKLNKYEDSIAFFVKAISINPNRPEVWNNLGNSYMNIGEHDSEMICYDNALILNPSLPETLFSKGSSLFRYFGEIESGLKLMLQSSELTDRYELDNPHFFFWISEAYFEKQDLENSIKWNQRGLEFFLTDEYLISQNKESVRKKTTVNNGS